MAPNVTPAPDTVAPADAVAPLVRGLTVLRRLTEADGSCSLSALERASGLARSTVDRITGTLARMGYLRLDGRDAVLAPRLMDLGNAYLAALRLPTLLDPHADALADELDESVSLAVADRDGIRFIHQATRRRAMSLSFRIGDLLPAERTAPGPLFATEWDDADWARWRARRAADPEDRGFPAVPARSRPPGGADDGLVDGDFPERTARARVQGWALDDQLIEPGLVALSLPVREAGGRIACVVSVVSHTSRHSADDLRSTLLPRLRTAVAGMERELREAPPAVPAVPSSGLAAWTGPSKQELGREFVESLARGLTVITSFGEGRSELTLSEVAEATGLARATARRALITLEHLGYVTSQGRAFRLTPRVLGLGYPPLSRATLSDIAVPHLTALSQLLHESASLGVPAGDDDVQVTARVAPSRIMSVDVRVGTRLPAHETSLGRVILADLPEPPLPGRASPRASADRDPDGSRAVLEQVRREGYALIDGELEEGLRSIAVPVRERGGRVVAAVNVALHSSRRTVQQCLTEVLPELRATAARIEADLRAAGRFRTVPSG
ncbi:IclR family transcriptional regulator C-terminal domain-containing protein [Streptomyces sp. NPDC007264]|uniref:IclR family transcriptional regulator domain-containing protein n=1 Tax=Streptomyces sp. NPDC007264 TaxID=3364777 RepID=UPI0036DE9D33